MSLQERRLNYLNSGKFLKIRYALLYSIRVTLEETLLLSPEYVIKFSTERIYKHFKEA